MQTRGRIEVRFRSENNKRGETPQNTFYALYIHWRRYMGDLLANRGETESFPLKRRPASCVRLVLFSKLPLAHLLSPFCRHPDQKILPPPPPRTERLPLQ